MSNDRVVRAHAVRSALLLLSAVVAAFGTISLLLRWIEDAGVPYRPVRVQFGIETTDRLAMAEAKWAGRRSVAFLGDSTVVSYPEGEKIPDELQRGLDERAPSTYSVGSFASGGESVFEFYALADPLIAASPDWVVLPFNLLWLSKTWRDSWTWPEATGWLPMTEYATALTLPLHWWGVTLDRLLLWRSFVASGHAQLWHDVRREQLRSGLAVQRLRRRLQGASTRFGDGFPPEPPVYHPARRHRLSARRTRQLYGDAIAGVPPDHPVIVLFEALLRRFVDHGSSVLVYIVPANVDHFETVVSYERAELTRTIAEVEAVARRQGASFLDLHHLLPDRAFRDGCHYNVEEPLDGPKLIAEELVPFIASTTARD